MALMANLETEAATKGYYHCVPAWDDDLEIARRVGRRMKKRRRFDIALPDTRELGSPSVIEVSQVDIANATGRKNASNPRSIGFHPLANVKLKRSATQFIAEEREVQTIPEQSKSAKPRNKMKEYEPTAPKYYFNATTYNSVLKDSSQLCEDIAQLPPPKHTLMTRELPFVYRYKIKQGMSSLNRMIPRRFALQPDHIW